MDSMNIPLNITPENAKKEKEARAEEGGGFFRKAWGAMKEKVVSFLGLDAGKDDFLDPLVDKFIRDIEAGNVRPDMFQEGVEGMRSALIEALGDNIMHRPGEAKYAVDMMDALLKAIDKKYPDESTPDLTNEEIEAINRENAKIWEGLQAKSLEDSVEKFVYWLADVSDAAPEYIKDRIKDLTSEIAISEKNYESVYGNLIMELQEDGFMQPGMHLEIPRELLFDEDLSSSEEASDADLGANETMRKIGNNPYLRAFAAGSVFASGFAPLLSGPLMESIDGDGPRISSGTPEGGNVMTPPPIDLETGQSENIDESPEDSISQETYPQDGTELPKNQVTPGGPESTEVPTEQTESDSLDTETDNDLVEKKFKKDLDKSGEEAYDSASEKHAQEDEQRMERSDMEDSRGAENKVFMETMEDSIDSSRDVETDYKLEIDQVKAMIDFDELREIIKEHVDTAQKTENLEDFTTHIEIKPEVSVRAGDLDYDANEKMNQEVADMAQEIVNDFIASEFQGENITVEILDGPASLEVNGELKTHAEIRAELMDNLGLEDTEAGNEALQEILVEASELLNSGISDADFQDAMEKELIGPQTADIIKQVVGPDARGIEIDVKTNIESNVAVSEQENIESRGGEVEVRQDRFEPQPTPETESENVDNGERRAPETESPQGDRELEPTPDPEVVNEEVPKERDPEPEEPRDRFEPEPTPEPQIEVDVVEENIIEPRDPEPEEPRDRFEPEPTPEPEDKFIPPPPLPERDFADTDAIIQYGERKEPRVYEPKGGREFIPPVPIIPEQKQFNKYVELAMQTHLKNIERNKRGQQWVKEQKAQGIDHKKIQDALIANQFGTLNEQELVYAETYRQSETFMNLPPSLKAEKYQPYFEDEEYLKLHMKWMELRGEVLEMRDEFPEDVRKIVESFSHSYKDMEQLLKATNDPTLDLEKILNSGDPKVSNLKKLLDHAIDRAHLSGFGKRMNPSVIKYADPNKVKKTVRYSDVENTKTSDGDSDNDPPTGGKDAPKAESANTVRSSDARTENGVSTGDLETDSPEQNIKEVKESESKPKRKRRERKKKSADVNDNTPSEESESPTNKDAVEPTVPKVFETNSSLEAKRLAEKNSEFDKVLQDTALRWLKDYEPQALGNIFNGNTNEQNYLIASDGTDTDIRPIDIVQNVDAVARMAKRKYEIAQKSQAEISEPVVKEDANSVSNMVENNIASTDTINLKRQLKLDTKMFEEATDMSNEELKNKITQTIPGTKIPTEDFYASLSNSDGQLEDREKFVASKILLNEWTQKMYEDQNNGKGESSGEINTDELLRTVRKRFIRARKEFEKNNSKSVVDNIREISENIKPPSSNDVGRKRRRAA